MKCQILFSENNKKNIINLSSAENAQRVVKVNIRTTVQVLAFTLGIFVKDNIWLSTPLGVYTFLFGHESDLIVNP